MIGYTGAKEEMYKLFYDAWIANSASIVGYIPEVRLQGTSYELEPDVSKFWVRWSRQTVEEGQETLRNGINGQCYRNEGVIFVQLFCPTTARTISLGEELAVIAQNAYRGKKTAGGVWFRNVRIKELEPEAKWFKFNIIAEYEYSENS